MKLGWTMVAVLVMTLTGCSRERGVATEVDLDVLSETSRSAAALPDPTPEPEPDPVEGTVAGGALAEVIEARWPGPEQGLSGALAAVPALRIENAGRLETRWLHVKKLGEPGRQLKTLHSQRLGHTVTDDLVDLRAFEGKGLPPFGWRDRTRGRTYVTPTMAAVLIRAYVTFQSIHPNKRLALGDLAQPGGGTLYHGTLVRDLEGREAEEVLRRARLIDGRLMAAGFRTAAAFPQETHRFGGPDTPVWVEETLIAQRGTAPLRLRVATRRYVETSTPPEHEVQDMLGDARRLVSRGTLVSQTDVPSWSEEGMATRVRQHWVDGRTRRQAVIFATRPQKRRLRMNQIYEIRLSRYSPRKPESFQSERRWIPSRFGEGKSARIRSWRRYAAVYEAGHITHLAGRDADISYATVGNRSHFAVDVASIDAHATWHWFEALDAAARASKTSLDRILIDGSVIRHLEARLPKKAKESPLFTRVMRRGPGHNAHHHLRLAAATEESDAHASALLAKLHEVDPKSLALHVTYSVPTPKTASAARNPDEAADSSPTPSR